MMRTRMLGRQKPTRYLFYIWEGGSYVAADAGEFPSDEDAIIQAKKHAAPRPLQRPASLDAPHLHVIRQDGIHIITVELPERLEAAVAAYA